MSLAELLAFAGQSPLLSALFVSGIIKPFDYEQRRAGLVWEYQWGNQDNPE